MKEEALKLADRLEEYSKINFWIDCTYEQYSEDKYFKEQSATIIRRLVEELDKQTKPLSKEEIDDLVHEHNLLDDYPYDFVRAIEERHGVK